MGPVSVYVITLREQAGDASPGVLALPKQECDEGQLGQLGGPAAWAGRIPGELEPSHAFCSVTLRFCPWRSQLLRHP